MEYSAHVKAFVSYVWKQGYEDGRFNRVRNYWPYNSLGSLVYQEAFKHARIMR